MRHPDDPEAKKLLRTKTRHGTDLLGAQLFLDGRAWTVCALAKQEHQHAYIWQWWVLMPDTSILISGGN